MSPTTHERAAGRFVAALAGTALVLPLVAVQAPANAAIASPTGLASTPEGASSPILSWGRVKTASSYQVQVDNDANFSSPEYTQSTTNYRAVPRLALRPGLNYWRVRAMAGGESSLWSTSSFAVSPIHVPVPVSPIDGAQLAQPDNPPLLEWQGSPKAQSYQVEVDGDSDFVGAKTYTTNSTSLVVPDPLGEGDWYWRVIAVKGLGLVSLPSDPMRFDVLPLRSPQLDYPVDSVDTKVGDVVVDWAPVPGAKSYDVEISDDRAFNPDTTTRATGVVGTRYSPATTLNNDQFWWRVRAIDLDGQATAWSETIYGFQRAWEDQPQAVSPRGTLASPPVLDISRQHYQWTPVPKASAYQLLVAADENFSVGLDVCYTAGTTYAPRKPSDCGYKSTGTTYWQVRPLDRPYDSPNGLPGQRFSPTQAFQWAGPAAAETWSGTFTPVDGMKVSVDASGVGCADDVCDNLPTTPVLTWDPQPGITEYEVYIGQDKEFTTSVLATRSVPIVTSNTMLALESTGRGVIPDQLSALPDSSAGQAYHWHVRPCTIDAGVRKCGPLPLSPPVPVRTKSFVKVSPRPTGLVSSDPSGTEITFSWDDYHATNQATTWNGEKANQSAKQYYIEVDDEPSFQTPLLDSAKVDQTTFTSTNRLYPEGTVYWRVRAIDDADNQLPWSDADPTVPEPQPEVLIKSSPAITLTAPASGATVSGTAAFRWEPQAFATSYTIEVYKNADTSYSRVNRLFTATARNPAYAWVDPIPADSRNYIWRVRRNDSKSNPGPWSTPSSFRSLGAAPVATSPANGALQPANGPLLTWTDVPGAASYTVRIETTSGAIRALANTVANAYAHTSAMPTGGYTWTVTALDSGRAPLGTSVARSFRVDNTPPKVISTKPTTGAKPKSNLVAKFSEPVTGVSRRTMKLYVKGSKKALRAKVRLNSTRTKAVLNPKARLKRGKTYYVKWRPGITDDVGLPLVTPRTWQVTVG